MQRFRAYIIGDDGHIQAAIDLYCENEQAAKEQAQQLVDGHDIELWQGGRQIAVIERANLIKPVPDGSGEDRTARIVVQEYADDLRGILQKLRRNLH